MNKCKCQRLDSKFHLLLKVTHIQYVNLHYTPVGQTKPMSHNTLRIS